jgi:hypothetical protein
MWSNSHRLYRPPLRGVFFYVHFFT